MTANFQLLMLSPNLVKSQISISGGGGGGGEGEGVHIIPKKHKI